MGISKGIASLTILIQKVTQKQNKNCLNVLVENNFKGKDYKAKEYIPFEDLMKKEPNRERYNCQYKNEFFIISCPVDGDFITSRTDSENEDSKFILTLTNEFCKIMNSSVSFSYIDDEDDPPSKFQDIINNKELKWLFKYNYFGKDFIEKYGKDFFLNMPCENVTQLTDDIIRVDLTKDIFKPVDKELAKKVYNYLQGFDIKVSFYNYKDFLID